MQLSDDVFLVRRQLDVFVAQTHHVTLIHLYIKNIALVYLPADRRLGHGNRDFVALRRLLQALLPGAHRADAADDTVVGAQHFLADHDAPRQHAHAEDGGVTRAEGVPFQELDFAGVREFLAQRSGLFAL